MKNSCLVLVILLSLRLAAQTEFQFVAVKTGLNIRDKPDVTGNVIGKIPYATKISLQETTEELKRIRTEGLTGYWKKVTYNNKTGYVVDSYLLPFAPPKAGTNTIKDYFGQVSAVFGAPLHLKSGERHNTEEGGYELRKQLYKNGAEWHEFLGYEYGSATYFLPEFTMQQAFLLLRMIPEFKEVFGEKDEFPTADKNFSKGEDTYKITVDKEMISDDPWIKKITVEWESGAIYSFEMYQIDNQIVIFYGSGV